LALTSGAYLLGPSLWAGAGQWLKASLSAAADPSRATPTQLWGAFSTLGSALLLPLASIWLLAVLADLAQIGPLFAWRAVGRGTGAVGPSLGTRLLTLALLLAGVVAACFIAAPGLGSLSQVDPSAPGGLGEALMRFAGVVLAALALAAAIDVAGVRARHFRSLFITRHEARRELREAEGSPEVRRERARLMRRLAREGDRP